MQQYRNNVQDQFGNILANVTVTVNELPGGGLATIFSDDGVTPKSNPFTNDSDSEFFFYAANGRYDIELTGPLTESIPDIILFDEDGLFTPIQIRTDIVTATPPTTEAVTGNYEIVDLDGTDLLAQFGFSGANVLHLHNFMHGGNVSLIGEDAAGIQRSFLVGDPDALTTISAVTNVVVQVNNGETAIVCIGNGNVELYEQNQKRFASAPNGHVHIFSDTDTDVEGRAIVGRQASGLDRWSIGNFSTGDLRIVAQVHGGNLTLEGEDVGGLNRVFLEGDPDGVTTLGGVTDVRIETAIGELSILCNANDGVTLYHNGIAQFQTQGAGSCFIQGSSNTDTDPRVLEFRTLNESIRGWVGHKNGASTTIGLKSEIHGANVSLFGEDLAGTNHVILQGDPDGATQLYFDGVLELATRVDGGTFITRAQVRHADGNMRDIGLAILPIAEIDVDDNLERQNSHKLIHKDAGVATSFELQNDSSIPTGTTWMIANEDTEDITIDATTNGSLLKWYDGLGAVLPTGDRTLAQGGVCTVYKRGVNEYYIWGTGLT